MIISIIVIIVIINGVFKGREVLGVQTSSPKFDFVNELQYAEIKLNLF